MTNLTWERLESVDLLGKTWIDMFGDPQITEYRSNLPNGSMYVRVFPKGVISEYETGKARRRGTIGQDEYVRDSSDIAWITYKGNDGTEEFICIRDGKLVEKKTKSKDLPNCRNFTPTIDENQELLRALPQELQQHLEDIYSGAKLNEQSVKELRHMDNFVEQLSGDISTLRSMCESGLTSPQESARITEKWLRDLGEI